MERKHEKTATVIYRYGHNWKTKCNFEVFAAIDFIAAIEHIPDRQRTDLRPETAGWR
ncbi:MAG: hypothetical protein R3F19_23215 [Verrucomicrobiales bacterium]